MYDDFSVGTAKVTKSVAYMLTLDLLINRAMEHWNTYVETNFQLSFEI